MGPEALTSLFFILSFPASFAILTGYETTRLVTDNPKFGCSWSGGSVPGVSCTCTPDAEEMVITKNSIDPYDTSNVAIHNCKSVRFDVESISEMRNLRNLQLHNIQSLTFEEYALKWYGSKDRQYEETYDVTIPSLRISIENSNITKISRSTFEGRISSIRFNRATVDNVDPFAFNALMQNEEIVLKDVQLRDVREQTFKKFTTRKLEFDGVKANIIPSRYVNEIAVLDSFRITNCAFEAVRPGGFIVSYPAYFEVSETRIGHLDGEAFKVTTRGDALFKNNAFDVINDGAFRAISLDYGVNAATLTFDSNVFTTLTRDSLGVSDDFRPKFVALRINETCDCKSIDHNLKEAQFYAEMMCKYEDEFVTVEEYKTYQCSVIQSYSNVIIIVVVVLTLCFIIGVVLVVYYRKVYLSRKYGDEKNAKKGNMSLIVPDGRTYRETELHVIVERADLLTTDL